MCHQLIVQTERQRATTCIDPFIAEARQNPALISSLAEPSRRHDGKHMTMTAQCPGRSTYPCPPRDLSMGKFAMPQ
eukprot:10402-Eustigmatos_ZCMA.PRE.1